MKRKLFQVFWILSVLHSQLVSSLKCYLTGSYGQSFSKDCDPGIAERYGTNPACLTAIVLDEYKNPLEYRHCSKSGATELPGGCELLQRQKSVVTCSLCFSDNCNKPDGYNKATPTQQSLLMLTFSFIIVISSNIFS